MTSSMLWWMLIAAATATYLWRLAGVVIGSRLSEGGLAMQWLSSVVHALIAALCVRLVLTPAGPLASLSIEGRLAAVAAALLVWWFSGRRMLLACWVAVLAAWVAAVRF